MAEFKKRATNNFWHSPLVLIVLFCVVIIFAYKMIDLVKRENETSKKKALILSEINSLQKRESDLAKNIEALKTEQGTEKTIRDKYQVVKPGEKMVVIVDEEPLKPQQDEIKSSHSFWEWLKGLFERR